MDTPEDAEPGSEDTTRSAAPPTPSGADAWIGPYRLIQRLGAGGMGEVWLAEQASPLRRQVAIKFVKAGLDSDQVIARFDVERQALALMDHPNIARVFDAGMTSSGRPYFVMEYVRGVPITQHCDEHRLNTSQRLELFLRVCDGVGHAHQRGVIHRDIKPANILVEYVDGRATPKLIDFGVAKALGAHLSDRPMATLVGSFIGTPEYMSPEQAGTTPQDVDTRTDVYSLGVLLYELLVGALPIDPDVLRRAGYEEMRRCIREIEPSKPSSRISDADGSAQGHALARSTDPGGLRRSIAGDLDWITLRTLEKDRERRYPSVTHLAEDLRRHLRDEPVQSGPPSAAYRAFKFYRRHRYAVWVSSVGIVLSGVLSASVIQSRVAAREAKELREKAAVSMAMDSIRIVKRHATLSVSTLAPLSPLVRRLRDGTASREEEELCTRHLLNATFRGPRLNEVRQPGIELLVEREWNFDSAGVVFLMEPELTCDGVPIRTDARRLALDGPFAIIGWSLKETSTGIGPHVLRGRVRVSLLSPERRALAERAGKGSDWPASERKINLELEPYLYAVVSEFPESYPIRVRADSLAYLFESGMIIAPLLMRTSPTGRVVELRMSLPRLEALPMTALEVCVRRPRTNEWLPVMGILTNLSTHSWFGIANSELSSEVSDGLSGVQIRAVDFWPQGDSADVRVRSSREVALSRNSPTERLDAYFDVDFIRRVSVRRAGP